MNSRFGKLRKLTTAALIGNDGNQHSDTDFVSNLSMVFSAAQIEFSGLEINEKIPLELLESLAVFFGTFGSIQLFEECISQGIRRSKNDKALLFGIGCTAYYAWRRNGNSKTKTEIRLVFERLVRTNSGDDMLKLILEKLASRKMSFAEDN